MANLEEPGRTGGAGLDRMAPDYELLAPDYEAAAVPVTDTDLARAFTARRVQLDG